jgi:predicted amidohydrolase
MEHLLKQAKEASCQALLLPEYACLSLLVYGYAPEVPFRERLQRFAEDGHKLYEARILELSHLYQISLIGGTYPVSIAHGQIWNRCLIARKQAASLVQDKLHMTRFEAEEWHISSPQDPQLKVFDLEGVQAAVAICYDIEFPRVAAAAAEAGVELLLVPSCTDHVHGYWRVRHCAQARTVENQCFVAMASVVEGDTRFPEMDAHYGQAAIFSPCDGRFPEKGILAEGVAHHEGMVWADLDFDYVQEIRKNGSVLNLRDQGQGSHVTAWMRV